MASQTKEFKEDGVQDSKDIIQILDGVNSTSFGNDEARSRAVLAAYALISRIETPWETTARLCMAQPALMAALKVGMDLKLFEKWSENGNKELTTAQLAELVSCDPAFLIRILRHLAANNMLEECPSGGFQLTKFTGSLVQPVFGEWINHLFDSLIPCFHKTPEYLAHTNYSNPSDPSDGIFQYTKSWKGDFFEYMSSHPREGQTFNHVMGGVMAHQAGWLDIFPYRTLLDSNEDQPLVVDVGGNIGHDITRLYKAHPELAARLYLQDKPEVIKLSKCPDPINKMAYDFFTPQPIKGAHVYYMHGVLHDWSDELAVKILEMQKGAMTPNYSKLLIHDHVIASNVPHPHTTAYDLTMMVAVAGKERSEIQWRELLEAAGYKLIKIWRSPVSVQSIIEAEIDG